jgi:hypothetical protein
VTAMTATLHHYSVNMGKFQSESLPGQHAPLHRESKSHDENAIRLQVL